FGIYESDIPSLGLRRASFADWGDKFPVTTGDPPTTTSSYKTHTFQAAPAREDCDYSRAQTPHRDGMITAVADGSVRIVSPGVAPAVFWGAVTPAGGEVLNEW